MKIAVTGPRGCLGRMVCVALDNKKHQAVLLDHGLAHITADEISECDALINCAGIVKQRPDPPETFAFVNAYEPHRIARVCTEAGARLIHVSTDCVFGPTPGPHTEGSIPTPEDLYAATKLAGEVTYDDHLTVRTSFVGYGKWGLVADLLAGKKMRASGTFLWNGHTAKTVAEMLVILAEKKVTGLIHIPGTQDIDRYALVMALANVLHVEALVDRNDDFWRDRRLQSDRWSELQLPTPLGVTEDIASLAETIRRGF